jgi:hypothetical protein
VDGPWVWGVKGVECQDGFSGTKGLKIFQKSKSQPQKSVRKNRQHSQIPGAQNAVGRAGAGMEVVGALPGVPSDSVKM